MTNHQKIGLCLELMRADSEKQVVQILTDAGYSDWLAADEAALDYIATRIAPKFGISAEVIAKRLRVEKLWPPT